MYSLKHLARVAVTGSVLAVVACESSRDLFGPNPPLGGEIFRSYVAIGNSITAGWQSGGINDSLQQQAYPRLLAIQMGTPYQYASLVAPGCPPPLFSCRWWPWRPTASICGSRNTAGRRPA